MARLSGCRSGRPPGSLPSAPAGARPSERARCSLRSSPLGALAFVVAAGVLLTATARDAGAQTTYEVWSATLTVGTDSFANAKGYSRGTGYGSLSDTQFDAFGADFTVADLKVIDRTGTLGHHVLQLSADNDLDPDYDGLLLAGDLKIGAASFTMLTTATAAGHQWKSTDYSAVPTDWAADDMVAVSLVSMFPFIRTVEFTSDPGTDATYAYHGSSVDDHDVVQVTVTFNAAVTVTGTPQLELDFDGTAKTADCAAHATFTTKLVCSYTVAENDSAPNGIAIGDPLRDPPLTLNGGTIKVGTGDVDLGLFDIPANAGHKVDGVLPTLESAETSADGTEVILTFSEPLTSTNSFLIVFQDGANLNQVISASVSGNEVTYGLFSALSHGEVITVQLTRGTVRDVAGNRIGSIDSYSVTNNVPEPPAKITGVAITSDPGSDGIYAPEDTVEATLTFDNAVDVTGTPQITFELVDGGRFLRAADYVRGTGTTELVFAYTVAATDESDTDGIDIHGQGIALNGGSITLAGTTDAARLLFPTLFTLGGGHRVNWARPTLTVAATSADGARIILTFNELLSFTPPSRSSFTVKVNGASASLEPVAVPIAGATYTLKPATAVTAGQTVTVSYEDPTTGDDATALEDRAFNDADSFTDQAVINYVGTPAAPGNLTAAPGTDRIALSWSTPSDGGSAITSYAYRQSSDGGDTWGSWTTITGSGAGTTDHTVTDLDSGTTYTLQVWAVNVNGNGPAAEASATVMLAEVSVAAAKSPFIEGTDTDVELTVSLNGSLTADLDVSVRVKGSGDCTNAVLGQEILLTFTTGETTHPLEFFIIDDSEYDEVSCSLTVEVLPPAPVSYRVSSTAGSVTVQIDDDDDPPQLQVSFAPDPPSVAEGDPIAMTIAITNSVVFARETELAVQSSDLTAEADDYQVPASIAFPAGQASVGATITTVGDAVAEADETFEVTVEYQAAGVAQSFGPFLVTIENDDPPSAPLNLAATPGLDTVTLSWNTPTNGGPTITDYQYRQSIDGGVNWNPDWTDVPDSGPTTTGYTVTGLDPGTDYTFEVHARNGAGPGDASAQATAAPTMSPPPAAPVNLQAAADTDRVTLSWTTPHAGGSPITGYRYRQSSDGGLNWNPDWTAVPDSGPTTTGHTVMGLDPDTTYTFAVRALNADGNGAVASVSVTTPAPPPAVRPPAGGGGRTGPPAALDAPTDLGVDAGARQVRLSWSTPDHGGTITGYEYRHSSDGGQTWSPDWTPIPDSGPNTTGYTVTDLDPGTDYIFEVRAVSDGVAGAAANVSAATTSAVPPAAPIELGADAGARQVRLSWSTPDGATITGYEYRHSSDGGQTWSPDWTDVPNSGPTTTGYTVTDLEPGTTYTFEVRALNADGSGAAANVSAATSAVPPAAPTDLRAEAGAAQVRLSWSTPADDGGSAITGHQYRHTAAGATFGAWTDIPDSAPGQANANRYTVSGLQDGTTYTFEVRALNAAGAGAAASVSVTLPPALPQAWLARLGRTVAAHAVDAVTARLYGTPATHVRIGGPRLQQPTAPAPAPAPQTDHPAADGPEPVPMPAPAPAAAPETDDPAADRPEPAPAPAPAPTADAPVAALPPAAPRSLRADPALLPASPTDLQADAAPPVPDQTPSKPPEPVTERPFVAPAAVEQHHDSGHWTLWGHGAWSLFDGVDGALALHGEVRTGTAGLDFQRNGVLGGLAVALSWADGTFHHAASGDSAASTATLLAIHPYLRLTLHERLSLWGLFGYALLGDLSLQRTGAESLYTDAGMTMGAFGARGTLLQAAPTGGFELSAIADGMLVHIHSEATTGLRASSADVQRLRLRLDASWSLLPLLGGRLTPALLVGGRYDGGDADTGAGLLVGGRLSYALPAWGLSLTASGQALLLHEHAGFRQWGAGGSLRLDPGARGRGLALRVNPSWGVPAAGEDGLSSLPDAADWTDPAQLDPPARLDAELSYGLDAPGGGGLLTPYAGLALDSAGQRTWRFGSRLRLDPGFSLLLQGSRTDTALPHHSLTLTGSLRS